MRCCGLPCKLDGFCLGCGDCKFNPVKIEVGLVYSNFEYMVACCNCRHGCSDCFKVFPIAGVWHHDFGDILIIDENGEEYRGEAYEAYLSLQDDEDEFFHVQLDDNRLTISSFFHETDEAGNLYPAPISYDYYLQRLVMLDLEWNRPLAYDLLNQ